MYCVNGAERLSTVNRCGMALFSIHCVISDGKLMAHRNGNAVIEAVFAQRGGYYAILRFGPHEKVLQSGAALTTNNRRSHEWRWSRSRR